MVRKKNLSKNDLEDVSTWEDRNQKSSLPKYIYEIPIKIKCLNEKQKELKKTIEDKEITIVIGPPGTGKTYLSIITALHLLKTEPKYKQLVLIKSLQTIQGEEMGYLPGTIGEKLEPYMYSFTGNLDKIFGDRSLTKHFMNNGTIIVQPLAYIRGNTLDSSIILVDESQNLTLHLFRTIVSRIGKNSKMIFLGDTEQIDRKNPKESCLQKVFDGFKPTELVGTVEFSNSQEECVRNPIIPQVLEVLNNL